MQSLVVSVQLLGKTLGRIPRGVRQANASACVQFTGNQCRLWRRVIASEEQALLWVLGSVFLPAWLTCTSCYALGTILHICKYSLLSVSPDRKIVQLDSRVCFLSDLSPLTNLLLRSRAGLGVTDIFQLGKTLQRKLWAHTSVMGLGEERNRQWGRRRQRQC